MHRSIEEGFLVSMIEGDLPEAEIRISPGFMRDGELIEFYETISKSMDVLQKEITRRGLRT